MTGERPTPMGRSRTLFLGMMIIIWCLGCAVNPEAFLERPPEVLSDQESALMVLQTFFSHLHGGNYVEAVPLYGGDLDVLRSNNPSVDPDDLAGLLRNACQQNGFQCLEVGHIVSVEQITDYEYLITVNFQNADGSLFERGPCCGASETDMPTQADFSFRVIKKEGGSILVMDLPVYVP